MPTEYVVAPTRAAIVIGVDRTGRLPPLRAAASGAEEVSNWLCDEGYAVTRLVDSSGAAVTLAAVKAAVNAHVERGTIDTLLIYFAGHGYLNGTTEIWLLSGAPEDPNEAVDQEASAEFARMSGIPNIIFISDSCRSTPQSLGAMMVRGGIIFPNKGYGAIEPEIDRVFATRPGDPAVELPLDPARTQYSGLFTTVLKEIYLQPAPEDPQMVTVDGTPMRVVTNRRLKQSLPDRFVRRANGLGVRIKQKPQLRLECGSDTFIATAAVAAIPSAPVFRRAPRVAWTNAALSLEDTARDAVHADGKVKGMVFDQALRGETSPAALDFLMEIMGQRDAGLPDHQDTGTGVRVAGGVRRAISVEGEAGVTILEQWREDETLIRLHAPGNPEAPPPGPASLLLELDSGPGILVAVIPGHWATVALRDGAVANIAYVPSPDAPGRSAYIRQREANTAALETAAAAARRSVLGVDRPDAIAFLDRVLAFDVIDPTLALYAAAALAGVGLRRMIAPLADRLQAQFGFIPFDVAMLDGRDMAGGHPPPHAPMLTQSWSYLAARGVALPSVLGEVPRLPVLWTTFAPAAMPTLFRWATAGERT